MKDFFGNMNFPRAVIIVSLLASAVLGYFVRERTDRLAQIHEELRRVPELVKSIQQLGITHTQYQEAAAGKAGVSDNDYDPYIRRIAADDLVGIGQVQIDPSKKKSKDTEDRIYKIKPAQKNQKYYRAKIGNFLYKLETDSRRVKVTRFKLTPHKKLKPGDVGNDQWTFEATITSRMQITSST